MCVLRFLRRSNIALVILYEFTYFRPVWVLRCCFKFDDENRTAQPDSIEIDSSNTNKRIRLLNLNIAEKLVEEPSNESESRNEPAHNSEQADHWFFISK